MVNFKIKQDREEVCSSPARNLDWESGYIRCVEDALAECDKVDTCNLKCKCLLREAYHFYLNQQCRYEK
jgi:hypothetical protein